MRILLVEDDAFFQHFYQSKLSETGFVIEVAKDGEEGLEKARTLSPDVILLDIVMPKKNGFEFLQERAGDPKLKKIPVIVFSTLGQEQDIEKAKQYGANDFVGKSFFDYDNLLRKIFLFGSP